MGEFVYNYDQVFEEHNSEMIFKIPDEILKITNWQIGDTIEFIYDDDSNTISLKIKDI